MIKSFFEKARQNGLVRNTFWMFLGQGARIPIQAVYFILIARSLGAQGYGAFVGVAALVAILAPFVSFGSGHILIKHASRDEAGFPRYWGKALLLTVLTGAFLVILAAVLSKMVLPAAIPFDLIVSISVADLIFSRILDVSAQAFQAFHRLGRTSQLMVMPNAARLILASALVMYIPHPSCSQWGYLYLAGTVISCLLGVYLVHRDLGNPTFELRTITSEIREGLYFSVAQSSQNIYNDMDKTMLARMVTLHAAGIYGAAYRIVDVSFIPVRSLLYASYVRFFQNGIDGIRGTIFFAIRLLPYAAGYGLAVSLVLLISAPILPYVLGASFNDTVYALQWLSLLPLIKVCHYLAADALTGAGFQGRRSLCQFLTAVVNIVFVLWLVPMYSWKGAAWASLLSDSFLALALGIVIVTIPKKHKEDVSEGAVTCKT